MNLLRPWPPGHRAAAVAVAISAVLHVAAVTGIRIADRIDVSLEAPAYEATLAPAVVAVTPPAVAAAPAPRPRPRKPAPRPGETVAFLPDLLDAAPSLPAPDAFAPEPEPLPEIVAMALPSVPVAAEELPAFRPDALPAEVSISYTLTSAFADGEAEYTWKRDGDRYEITGTAQAVGFFTLFLEGRIDQVTTGQVTDGGLRPDRFRERRGSTPEEGLTFDWNARQVQFRRGDQVRTGPLTDATVDWLSMIFQLAHMPPAGQAMELRVFTQRRLHQYRLQVVGPEVLELPFGRADTLHLRHTGNSPEETVDVWLGVAQYHLPVKLRYPVARNRLIVEQTATAVTAR